MPIVCIKKLEKTWGAYDNFFLVSDSAIEHFNEIVEEHEFKNGLSMLKMLNRIKAKKNCVYEQRGGKIIVR